MNTKVSTGHYGEGLHVTGHFPFMAKLQTGRGKPLYSSYSHQSKPVGEDEVKERREDKDIYLPEKMFSISCFN